MVGVDIGKSCHTACFGTQLDVLAKKFEFTNSKDGFKNIERIILLF
jgi:transposase